MPFLSPYSLDRRPGLRGRRLVPTTIAVTLVLWSGLAQAQETPTPPPPTTHHIDDEVHVGLGAGFSLFSLAFVGGGVASATPFGGGAILLPIDILGAVRLEPELGVFHAETSREVGSESIDDSATSIRPALGLFWIFALGENAQGNLGARVGPVWTQTKSDSPAPDPAAPPIETTTTRVDWAIGPAFGGEYFFSEHFSLGAEMQLNFTIVGNETSETDPGPVADDNETSGLVIGTNTVLTARVFF